MASKDTSSPTEGSPEISPPNKPMNYLIRLSQFHEDFRLPELQALAELAQIPTTILSYTPTSPILLLTAPSPAAATALIQRAILTQSVYEHWATATTLEALHTAIKTNTKHLWPSHTTASWKFSIDAFQGGASRTPAERTALINTFRYLPLTGPIRMTDPDLELTIFEEYAPKEPYPHTYHFGRLLARSDARTMATKFDLKKRPYISTTSMAADLTLITANLALAAPGKLFYDPFAGTGSFPLASAAFGAVSWGSDIDGRAVRGSGNDARDVKGRGRVGGERTVRGNFVFYGLEAGLGDVFTCDLTNSPLRRVGFRQEEKEGGGGGGGDGSAGRRRLFDGVVCDPPYGVREGLRVLGCKDPEGTPWIVEAGVTKYKDPTFIPPKKPYSFHAMLQDILHFASETLVDNGRLAFWMPTANDEAQELAVPTHPCLELVSVCVQPFNRWSRRLITYRKLPDETVAPADVTAWLQAQAEGKRREEGAVSADELNPFRKGYFSKFVRDTPP